ncbi:hypothetical protein C8J56DRAFT_1058023 [Mycena floridula]|nr:hypothetical protein C8J56DRAFT_1058023 [Mycena floridula]
MSRRHRAHVLNWETAATSNNQLTPPPPLPLFRSGHERVDEQEMEQKMRQAMAIPTSEEIQIVWNCYRSHSPYSQTAHDPTPYPLVPFPGSGSMVTADNGAVCKEGAYGRR